MSDFIYIKSNFIPGDLNSNGDRFVGVKPEHFLGKPVVVDFQNDDIRKTVGMVVDALEVDAGIHMTIAIDKNVNLENLQKSKFSDEFSIGCSGYVSKDGDISIDSASLLRNPPNKTS